MTTVADQALADRLTWKPGEVTVIRNGTVILGEGEGHPFRGNRYTGGIGGGGPEAAPDIAEFRATGHFTWYGHDDPLTAEMYTAEDYASSQIGEHGSWIMNKRSTDDTLWQKEPALMQTAAGEMVAKYCGDPCAGKPLIVNLLDRSAMSDPHAAGEAWRPIPTLMKGKDYAGRDDYYLVKGQKFDVPPLEIDIAKGSATHDVLAHEVAHAITMMQGDPHGHDSAHSQEFFDNYLKVLAGENPELRQVLIDSLYHYSHYMMNRAEKVGRRITLAAAEGVPTDAVIQAQVSYNGRTITCYASRNSLHMGESEGHAFRGNRYTGGIPGGDRADDLSISPGLGYVASPGDHAGADAAGVYNAEGRAMQAYREAHPGPYVQGESARILGLTPQAPPEGMPFDSLGQAQAYTNDVLDRYGDQFRAPSDAPDAPHPTVTIDGFDREHPSRGYAGNTNVTGWREYRIRLGPNALDQRTVLHELAHVLGANRDGPLGHGRSFRDALLTLTEGEMPEFGKFLRGSLTAQPESLTAAEAGPLDEFQGEVIGPDGQRIACRFPVPDIHAGEGPGHAFRGNRYTGGIPGGDTTTSSTSQHQADTEQARATRWATGKETLADWRLAVANLQDTALTSAQIEAHHLDAMAEYQADKAVYGGASEPQVGADFRAEALKELLGSARPDSAVTTLAIEKAQAYADHLVATYGPRFNAAGTSVKIAPLSLLEELFSGTAGRTVELDDMHHHEIYLASDSINARTLAHEMGHVFGFETHGYPGHGISYRDVVSRIYEGEWGKERAARFRAALAKGPLPITAAEAQSLDDESQAPVFAVVVTSGTPIAICRDYGAGMHAGEAEGHAFRGNRYTGGIPGAGGATTGARNEAWRAHHTPTAAEKRWAAGRESHADWRQLVASPVTIVRGTPKGEATHRDAMAAYAAEEVAAGTAERPFVGGQEFASLDEATAYAKGLVEKYGGENTRDVVVVTNTDVRWDVAGRTNPISTPADDLHHYTIGINSVAFNQLTVAHEVAHIIGAERFGGLGHGVSFRNALAAILEGEWGSAVAADYQRALARQPRVVTAAEGDDRVRAVLSAAGHPVLVCMMSPAKLGEATGHAFRGNRYTGGIPGEGAGRAAGERAAQSTVGRLGSKESGFTIRPVGFYGRVPPRRGFMVGGAGSVERIGRLPADRGAAKALIRQRFDSFAKAHPDELKPERHYMGLFRQGNRVWLEVSELVDKRAEAMRLGRVRNQISIWDNAKQVTVATGGTGT